MHRLQIDHTRHHLVTRFCLVSCSFGHTVALSDSMSFFFTFVVTLLINSSSFTRRPLSPASCLRAPWVAVQMRSKEPHISSSSSSWSIFFLGDLDALLVACFGMFASRVPEEVPL